MGGVWACASAGEKPPAPKAFDAESFTQKLKLKDMEKQKSVLAIMREYASKRKAIEDAGRPTQSMDQGDSTKVSVPPTGEPPQMSDADKAKMKSVKASLKELRTATETKVSAVLDKKDLKKWSRQMDKMDEDQEEAAENVFGHGLPPSGFAGGPGNEGPGGF
jgi:hypothetical protein